MKNSFGGDYVLGLDLGAQSIGWALLPLKDGNPAGLLRLGTRVFEAGVQGDVESGQDASRNVERRERRMARRMLLRRTRRLVKLALILQRASLLPKGDVKAATQRDRFFAGLDRTIFARHTGQLAKQDPTRKLAAQLPYFLRARALSEKLSPDELGRALYHLAQRRGFLSNRREKFAQEEGDKNAKKELGPVKKGIAELEEKIAAAHTRTLGEYFAGLDPHQERIRKRWTARAMFEKEFEAIWSTQAVHHPAVLTDTLKKEVHDTIFFQRPLRRQKFLVGWCSQEPKAKRARWALLLSQRFRMLQRVNDLLVVDKETGEQRPLSPDERQALLGALETKGDLKFPAVRKLLGLKHHVFNLEEGGEPKLPGNRTAARLMKVFGAQRWSGFSQDERNRIVEDMLSLEDHPDALARRGETEWGLDPEAAQHFANVALEPDYCGLSTKAMRKLLPILEQGTQYATARKQVYGEVVTHTKPADSLDGVFHVLPALRNPTVARVLTELRTLVNSFVREYGKPAEVRIELARDLKKTRKDRQQIWKKYRENQARRDEAQEKIKTETGLAAVKGPDIEKVLLAEECGCVCPYTGRQISMASLVGPTPQFDVEHIIPLSKSFDNSFVNKTLCYHEENRNVKKGRTPFEAYGGDKERYDEILERVRKFNGPAAKEKLRRFQLDDLSEFEEFASRQLNDTRYASRLAASYVGLLYGGRTDDAGRLRVQVSRGQVTKYLRDEWDLNRILGDGGQKTRTDHRHHAVDALVVALTDMGTVKMLSDAAAQAERNKQRRFAPIAPPWPSFLNDVRKAVGAILVSHRPNRRVSGALHEETIYSPPKQEIGENGKPFLAHHVRKPLEKLTKNELDEIVDPVVKSAVLGHLAARDGDLRKAFGSEKDHPFLTTKDGRKVPIHKARIRVREKLHPIGSGPAPRYAALGSNHHVEIFQTSDAKGRVKWDGEVVSMFEAYQRLEAGKPIVNREHGPGKKFILSLCGGDTVELDDIGGKRAIFVIRTLGFQRRPDGQYPVLEFVRLNDARRKKDIQNEDRTTRARTQERGWQSAPMGTLYDRHCQKVVVTPVGEVRRAND